MRVGLYPIASKTFVHTVVVLPDHIGHEIAKFLAEHAFYFAF
jgi:hypothetical protein